MTKNITHFLYQTITDEGINQKVFGSHQPISRA